MCFCGSLYVCVFLKDLEMASVYVCVGINICVFVCVFINLEWCVYQCCSQDQAIRDQDHTPQDQDQMSETKTSNFRDQDQDQDQRLLNWH